MKANGSLYCQRFLRRDENYSQNKIYRSFNKVPQKIRRGETKSLGFLRKVI